MSNNIEQISWNFGEIHNPNIGLSVMSVPSERMDESISSGDDGNGEILHCMFPGCMKGR
jgi:hypothetical protein